MFGSTPGLSINTGGGMFGQPSQPSLFGGGIFGTPASQPGNALALTTFSQPGGGQQLAAPGMTPTLTHIPGLLSSVR